MRWCWGDDALLKITGTSSPTSTLPLMSWRRGGPRRKAVRRRSLRVNRWCCGSTGDGGRSADGSRAMEVGEVDRLYFMDASGPSYALFISRSSCYFVALQNLFSPRGVLPRLSTRMACERGTCCFEPTLPTFSRWWILKRGDVQHVYGCFVEALPAASENRRGTENQVKSSRTCTTAVGRRIRRVGLDRPFSRQGSGGWSGLLTLSRCKNMLRMLMTATELLNRSKNRRHSSESRQPLMSSSTKLNAAAVAEAGYAKGETRRRMQAKRQRL